jgi:hypothetical protein
MSEVLLSRNFSVAVIMAARAQQERKMLYWDAETEQILDRPPA